MYTRKSVVLLDDAWILTTPPPLLPRAHPDILGVFFFLPSTEDRVYGGVCVCVCVWLGRRPLRDGVHYT